MIIYIYNKQILKDIFLNGKGNTLELSRNSETIASELRRNWFLFIDNFYSRKNNAHEKSSPKMYHIFLYLSSHSVLHETERVMGSVQ